MVKISIVELQSAVVVAQEQATSSRTWRLQQFSIDEKLSEAYVTTYRRGTGTWYYYCCSDSSYNQPNRMPMYTNSGRKTQDFCTMRTATQPDVGGLQHRIVRDHINSRNLRPTWNPAIRLEKHRRRGKRGNEEATASAYGEVCCSVCVLCGVPGMSCRSCSFHSYL